MLGAEVDEAMHGSVLLDARADRVLHLRISRLPEEQALHLDGQHHGDDGQEDPDAQRADAVVDRIARDQGGADRPQGDDQADLSAEVLEQHDRELRVLRMADELPPPGIAPHLVGLHDGGAEGVRLQQDGEEEDADGDRGRLHLMGISDLLDAFIDGEGAAEAEEHEGHDEGPEVALAAVAEGMLLVGLAAGPLAAEEQETLIA